ncbi:WD40/YVTN/BNR-like repeat-containing protein [Cytobacillus kochii]|uniref:WD40/YVTN/BNR-like repeat-containing protein n=1 Tax=Cytobacillus kochii TaxID=859143 RepID=UPI00247FE9BC|nr:hypothetical protein [Cytobacillus kochii]
MRNREILDVVGARVYAKMDITRPFIGDDGTVYAIRASNQRKLVKITPDDTNAVVDLYQFSQLAQSGFKSSGGSIFVCTSYRIGAQHNYPSEIWRSVDGGQTFTKVLTTIAGGPIYWSYTEDSQGNLFIAEYGYKYSNEGKHARYIHKSADGGVTWNVCFDTGAPYDSHIHNIEVDPYDESIFVSVGDTNTQQLWRSTDAGDNWTMIKEGIQHISCLFFESGILWGSDDHTGTITLMKRGTWEETIVYTHKNNEAMWYGMTRDTNGNVYAHAHDDSRPGWHYTIIGSGEKDNFSMWRDLDYESTFSMSSFINGRCYCDGYVMKSLQTQKRKPIRA